MKKNNNLFLTTFLVASMVMTSGVNATEVEKTDSQNFVTDNEVNINRTFDNLIEVPSEDNSQQFDIQALAGNESDAIQGGPREVIYSKPIYGQHKYGRYTVLLTGVGDMYVQADLLRNDGTGWVNVDGITANVTTPNLENSKDYYMEGGVQYRVRLTTFANYGKSYIRNY